MNDDQFEFEDETEHEEISDDSKELIYCFSCWGIYGIIDNETPFLKKTEDYVKDKTGRYISTSLCSTCINIIPTLDVLKDVVLNNPQMIEGTPESESMPVKKSKETVESVLKSMNFKSSKIPALNKVKRREK